MANTTTLSIAELAQVRENVEKLLDELQLDAYLFEVDPQEGQWQLSIECATEEGWENVTVFAEEEYLLRGIDDAVIHATLIDTLGEALSACKIKK